MNVVLWTLQVVCAVAFVASGTMKSLMSKERMIATGQTGVAPFPLPMLRVVAVLELLGVAGLLLPEATGVARVLTPLSAGCLALVMVGAGISHSTLHEVRQVVFVNLPLFAALCLIAASRSAQL